jgi:hypothetical protein
MFKEPAMDVRCYETGADIPQILNEIICYV